MAQFHSDLWGPKLELRCKDVEKLNDAMDVTQTLNALVGAVAPTFAPAVGIFSQYITAQKGLIATINKGYGVWLTLPWPAVALGHYWLIVPTTREGLPGEERCPPTSGTGTGRGPVGAGREGQPDKVH